MVLRAVALASLLLSACASTEAASGPSGPEFVPERWFAGTTRGEGVFRRLGARADTRFSMVIEGATDGELLTMDETFTTPKGRWNRVWTIRKTGERTYAAALTTGEGPITVEREGDTVRMRYRAQAPLVDRRFVARFEQRLQLRPDGTVLNTADVYKYGIRVGRSTVVFRKAPAAE